MSLYFKIVVLLAGLFVLGGIFTWQLFTTGEVDEIRDNGLSTHVINIEGVQFLVPKDWRVENLSDFDATFIIPFIPENISAKLSVSRVNDISSFGSGVSSPIKIKNGTLWSLITRIGLCRWGLELNDKSETRYYEVRANVNEELWQTTCEALQSVIQTANEKQVGEVEVKTSKIEKPKTIDGLIELTADWQIYHNEKYGFEVKYPKPWFFEETNSLAFINPNYQRLNFIQISLNNGINLRESEETSRCQSGNASLTFQIGKLRENQETFTEFERFVNFLIENPERGLPPTPKPILIQTMLGGRNVLIIEKSEAYDKCESRFYYVDQSPDRYTTISFIVEKSADRLIIDQILSTIRFIDTKESSER